MSTLLHVDIKESQTVTDFRENIRQINNVEHKTFYCRSTEYYNNKQMSQNYCK